jgi:hypothetical protein
MKCKRVTYVEARKARKARKQKYNKMEEWERDSITNRVLDISHVLKQTIAYEIHMILHVNLGFEEQLRKRWLHC